MSGFMKQPTMFEQLVGIGQTDYLSSMSPSTGNFNLGDSGTNIGGGGNSWWDSLFDKTDSMGNKTQGVAMPLINGASALMSGFMGMKQYSLQKDALKQTKKEFDMNWDAQQKTMNGAMEDRQRARVASNPSAYQSVGDYMKKNGI